MKRTREVTSIIQTESEFSQIQKLSNTQDTAEDNGNLPELLEELRKEVVHGFLYSHTRANDNTGKVLEVTSFCYALIELLMEKGLLTEEELNERKRQVAQRMVEKFKDNGMGVMLQQPEIDKYTFESDGQIDCENRVHICKAACCRMRFSLSKQDLEEGIVKWNLACPYLIARETDGYCRHLERESYHCTIYQHRPVPCRAYDCRKDQRVWLDFENKIVSPELEKLFQNPDAVEVNQDDP